MKKNVFWLALIIFSATGLVSAVGVKAQTTTAPTTIANPMLTTVAEPMLTVTATTTRAMISNGAKMTKGLISPLIATRASSSHLRLEKIHSPQEIKEFKVMKRIGHALYGIRLSILRALYQSGKLKPNDHSALKNLLASSTAVKVSQTAISNSNKIEKIATPALIHLYRNIRRVGHSLWGIRRELGENQRPGMSGQKGNSESSSMIKNDSNKIEKIATPALIHLYRNIRRVGHSLWGVRKDISQGDNFKKTEKGTKTKRASFVYVSPRMISCAVNAIKVKDDEAIARAESAVNSLKIAITNREACQKLALQQPNNQRVALNKCVDLFQASRRQISKISHQAQQESWKTYVSSLKVCRSMNIPVPVVSTTSATTLSTPNTISSLSGQVLSDIAIPDGGDSTMQMLNNGSGD